MRSTLTSKASLSALLCLAVAVHGPAQQQPKIKDADLEQARNMLHAAYSDLKKNYYDPKFGGLDIDARYKEYNDRVAKAVSLNAGMAVVAGYLDGLKDSHTFFLPPMRPYTFEPGFRMKMVGDQCLVSRIRPKMDATEKLHPGDRILKFNNFPVGRDDLWTLTYYFTALSPSPVYELDLQSPDGATRHVSVKAFNRPGKAVLDLSQEGPDVWNLEHQGEDADHVNRSILQEVGDVTIWKMPQFNLESEQVDAAFARVRKHSTLVLDLRGDPGGYTDTLGWMVGSVFDHDVKIADRVGRKDSKPMIAKTRGNTFKGKMVVLVDSGSASAAELFARVMQLEHRATIIGDRSSGSVMESRHYDETSSTGGDTMVAFGFSITDANLIMADGKSLEKSGVVPDEVALPTAQDVAGGRDPVLAHAAELAGGKLTPESAGKLFPSEWEALY
jgi:C-terminal processing protease CtpA/Prc